MVKVDSLVKLYNGHRAVDGISFDVERGEVFVLLGPNGSGKTTTLRIMVGLTRPTSGRIFINDLDVWEKQKQARTFMSYLPQRVSLPENLSAKEVLTFYSQLRGEPRERVGQTLRLMRLNGEMNKHIGELSGGLLQRVALAIAFLPDIDIFIFDEPTVNLDSEGLAQFRALVKRLKEEGKIVIMASHLLSEVEELADRVAVMNNGRLLALERMEELRKEVISAFRTWVVLINAREEYVAIAMQSGATKAEFDEDTLILESAPENRINILKALEEAGARIERFGTTEPPLEEIYLKILDKDSF
jgi:ABC-2 type transport system ATP-binding protein/Cu-processing system ATP-binding protein